MTCKDLMLGDWVQGHLPNTPSKVVGIPNEYRLAVITPGGAYVELSIDDFLPIPITPEILMKSGWFWDTKCAKVNHDERFVLEYYPQEGILKDVYYLKTGDNCDVFKSKPGLIYLHQLQHAMRLCNIEKDITL